MTLSVLLACGEASHGFGREACRPGLAYECFGSPRLERSAGVGFVPDITAMDSGQNDWALRFTGLLTPPADGEYVFRVEADTGVRVRMADRLIVDGWSQNGARTGKATLAAGQPVALAVEYFFDRGQGGKTAALRLFWTPPGGREAPVPAAAYTRETPPIEVTGDDQKTVNLKLPDGGLKPVVGVQNFQILRACRNRPELADGNGWTYAHHQDLAVWKGRLYAAWAMTPQDEDAPPYRVVFATSTDGINWSAPADLFPRENAWACRFYFYRASNGCMLAFCAGKSADGTVSEAVKKVLLVRRITADHQLGNVYTLVTPLPDQPPSFETAADPLFIAACREAAGNSLLLEQQDYGVFLGDRRMRWHADPTLKIPGWCQFGKAFCFYHRADGDLVGLCKMGFATLSADAGKTWSKPVQPPTLIAGSAKLWGQRTTDNRFALAYTPDRDRRFPLVLVHGDDGREFKDMRVIHGELPRLRYPGKYTETGLIQAADGANPRELGPYTAGALMNLTITADLAAGSYTVQVNDGPAQSLAVAEQGCKSVQRLSLRTGLWRGLGDGGLVEPNTDMPQTVPAVFHVNALAIGPQR